MTISLISVIEHTRLGSYSDYSYDDGNSKTVGKLTQVLPTGGLFVIATILGNKCVITPGGNEIICEEQRFDRPIEKFRVAQEEYYIFKRKWTPLDKRAAFREALTRFVLACWQLKKKGNA